VVTIKKSSNAPVAKADKNKKPSRTISVLTATLLVLGIISFPAPITKAADADALAAQINAVSGLAAAVGGSNVTVTGTAHRTSGLSLSIDSDVTVIWCATLTGNITANNYLLTLSGGGKFELGDDGTDGSLSVTSGAGGTAYISGAVTLDVKNGIINSPGSGSAVTVAAGVQDAYIYVRSNGIIRSVPNGYAINDGSGMTASDNNTQIFVYGLVESGSACAIRSTGMKSKVTVYPGGVVRNNAASNTNSTIYMNYNGSLAEANYIDNIIINGGLVETINTGNQSYVLQSSQNILVSGGEVKAIAGRAINLVGLYSTATVTGGKVSTVSGTAISTATTTLDEVENAKVVISGGTVEATGSGTAVRITGANSTVTVSGGDTKVIAASSLAIDASGRPSTLPTSVNISGGLVFAWGNAINKVVSPEAKLNHTGGTIVAWNTTSGTGEYDYIQGKSNDLTMLPAASVTWDNEPSTGDTNGGIRYGTSSLFHALDVTVIREAHILTIVNGTDDGGQTSIAVKNGDPVTIIARDDVPINHDIVGPSPDTIYNYPINGDKFAKWVSSSGGTFGSDSASTTTFEMPGHDVTVTAEYNPHYLLHVAGGSIDSPRNFYTGGGYSASYGYYAPDDIITITKNSGYGEWNANDGVTVPTLLGYNYTFTMPDLPVDLIAKHPSDSSPISPNAFSTKYTTTADDGTIISTTAGVSVNYTSYESFAGTGLNIIAEPPATGYEFAGWKSSGGGTFIDASSAATVFITPPEDVTITAYFAEKTYTLTVEDGSGSQESIKEGASAHITANAAPEGMSFSCWTIDEGGGEFSDDNGSFEDEADFIMPDSNVTISAHYEYINYELTVIDGQDVFGEGSYHFGEGVLVSADPPEPGLSFTGWIIVTGSGSFSNRSASETIFYMPASDATIRATYGAPGQGGETPEPAEEPDPLCPIHGEDPDPDCPDCPPITPPTPEPPCPIHGGGESDPDCPECINSGAGGESARDTDTRDGDGTDVAVPKTDAQSNMKLWFALCALSAIAATASAILLRFRHPKKQKIID